MVPTLVLISFLFILQRCQTAGTFRILEQKRFTPNSALVSRRVEGTIVFKFFLKLQEGISQIFSEIAGRNSQIFSQYM